MSKNIPTPKDIQDAFAEHGNDFIRAEYERVRPSKNKKSSYISLFLKKATNDEGKAEEVPLGLTFKAAPIGGPKSPDKRDYAPVITIREGSDLYTALLLLWNFFEELVEEKMGDGTLESRKNKKGEIATEFCSIIQTIRKNGDKLDKPIVRVQLPFDKDSGRPMFKLQGVKKINGKNTLVNINVTEANVHKKITGGSVATGYLKMDSLCLSQKGYSVPAKAGLLVVKPGRGMVPKAEDIMNEDDLEGLVASDSEDGGGEDNEGDDAPDGEGDEAKEEKKEDDAPVNTEDELKAMAEMAVAED